MSLEEKIRVLYRAMADCAFIASAYIQSPEQEKKSNDQCAALESMIKELRNEAPSLLPYREQR